MMRSPLKQQRRHQKLFSAVPALMLLSLAACAGPTTDKLPMASIIPSEILHTDPAYEEATALRLGQGAPRDYPSALRSLRRLAELQGDSRAMNDLGIMYAQGQGVAKDYRKAAEWFISSAEHNNSSARYNLALLHLYGAGLEQDDARAVRLLINAASQGNSQAQVLLGYLYQSRGDNLGREAQRLYHRAAESGHLEAWRYMALTPQGKWLADLEASPRDIDRLISNMLVDAYGGTSFEASYDRSREQRELDTLRKRARDGNEIAQYNLGLRYERGKGVPLDASEAARWMTVSAEAGYAPAQYKLGLMYLNGIGVAHHPIYAHHWFHLASTNGREQLASTAATSLEALERQMGVDDIRAAQELTKSWRPNRRLEPVW